MDHLADGLLLSAIGLLLALPIATVLLWKRVDATRRRREMKEGNRIYKVWLDSSVPRERRK
ncbi:MAG TPA: hypothetical protein VLJ57_21400 [Burkholderiaceae bacterium]|nr:hypothetical protein [Burkholderiaceae bacterium]